MADLGFGAIGQGPLGDQGTELNFILTNQVGGSTIATALISINGRITTRQIERSDAVGLVYDKGTLVAKQLQHTNAILLIENRGAITTKQAQYSSVQATALITAGGLLATKQVQRTAIYALIKTFARAATAQYAQTVSSSAFITLSTRVNTREIQFTRLIGKVILYVSAATKQAQIIRISALITDYASIRTQQSQRVNVTTTQASVGSTHTRQAQTTNTSATLTDYLHSSTTQAQTTKSRARLLLYAYVTYDVFDSTAVSITVPDKLFIPEGSTITWVGAPDDLLVINSVDPPAIENLTLNKPVTVAALTPVTLELIYTIYGTVSTAQKAQNEQIEVQLINPPKPAGQAGGSGVYYGPFGAPFLIPLDQNWWPYGRKKRDRIEIATRFSRTERWSGIEYDTTKAPPRPTITTTALQVAQPKKREDLFTVRTTAPTMLPRKTMSVIVSDPRYIRTGSVGIGDFVVRESGEIVINNLRPVDFLVETSEITESSYSVNAKIRFNRNYTVGIKFDDPDVVED